MAPVSTTPDLTIGINGKSGSALPFDPIASRNSERPRFRLEDYERPRPTETEPARHTEPERDTRTDWANRREAKESGRNEDYAEARRPDAPDPMATEAPAPIDETDIRSVQEQVGNAQQPVGDQAARRPPTEESKGPDSSDKTKAASENGTDSPPAQAETTTEQKTESGIETSEPVSGNNESATASQGAVQQGATSAEPVAETDSKTVSETVAETSSAASAAAEMRPEIPGGEKTVETQPSTSLVNKPGQSPQAAESGMPPATVKDVAAKRPSNDAAAAQQNAAVQPSDAVAVQQSSDPKLTALQKLTQPKAENAQPPAQANVGDDKTSYTLPVPWPPETAAKKQPANITKPGASQPVELPADAIARAVTAGKAAAKSTNSAVPATQTVSANANQTNKPSTAAHNGVKVELELPGAAKPQFAADNAVLVNNRSQANGAPQAQNTLPSQSETIAAATALNSRVPRPNALGAAPQSNALTASSDKAATQSAANGNGGPTPVATTIATSAPASTATGTGTTIGAVAGQAVAAAGDAALGGRSQSGGGQSGFGDPGAGTATASRGGDVPSTNSTGSFGDALRSTATERTAGTEQPRQTLPNAATEQVRVKLVKAAQGGLDKIKIQLHPSELGKVEVRLEFGSDGGVRGLVTVDKPETLQLLQRDARQLEQALQDAGFKTGGDSLDFQMRGGGTDGRQQNAGNGNGSSSDGNGGLKAEDENSQMAADEMEQDGIGDDGSLNMVA